MLDYELIEAQKQCLIFDSVFRRASERCGNFLCQGCVKFL
jgi:hypothetical protein